MPPASPTSCHHLLRMQGGGARTRGNVRWRRQSWGWLAHSLSPPQVGIVLHYSTLSTMLWIGVAARNIYKQVTRKAPLCPGADQPPHPRQPLLRY